MSESELGEFLSNGDPRGFREVLTYYPRCRRPLLDMGISEDDCQDIFQNSVIVLYERLKAGTHRFESKISTFLYQVCKNMGRYFLRSKKDHQSLSDWDYNVSNEDEEGNEISFETMNEFDRDLAVQENELPSEKTIWAAIINLGYPCSEIIIAFYYYRATMKEIMEEFNYASIGSAKGGKHNCMQRLKNDLNPNRP